MNAEQFERQYGDRKPYFEYWFGQPVQKSMPTWVHALLQKIILRMLDDAGYESGAEVKLKISPDFQPLPDVSAVRPGKVESPYPTSPVEVVVEILSPDDEYPAVVKKCRYYHGLKIPNIYVVDPDTRTISRWEEDSLQAVPALLSISATEIWQELDRRI